MKFSLRNIAVYVVAIALMLAFSASSSALAFAAGSDAAPGYSSSDAGSAAASSVDDATLNRTAKAYLKVRQIVQNEQDKLNNTNGDAAKRQLADQAESAKVAAVKAEGLQPEQYNRVLELVQANQQVRQKFLSDVNSTMKSGARM
jgi:hypothetical protein